MAIGLETATTGGGRSGQRVETDAGPLSAEIPLFDALHDGAREALLAASSTRRAHRQQVVFCAGKRLAHLYVVLSGSLKLVRHSGEGKELIVALVREGDPFGSLSRSIESPTLAQALEDSSLLVVPQPALRRAMAANAAFALRLIARLEERQRAVELSLARIAFESVPRRLAHVLLDASDPSSGSLRFPLNQTEIASLIGSSRETVCSVLNQFRRNGWLDINHGRIRLTDRDELASVR